MLTNDQNKPNTTSSTKCPSVKRVNPPVGRINSVDKFSLAERANPPVDRINSVDKFSLAERANPPVGRINSVDKFSLAERANPPVGRINSVDKFSLAERANPPVGRINSFQNIMFGLQKYWSDYGCVIMQPYDTEVGAGTSHYVTTLKALGDDYWDVAFVQPCRRPKDGRYAENPNRTQYYFQYQVILKPAPINPQELYLKSLKAIGFDLNEHEIRFVEDDWENPSLGAAGVGWEIWCDGMEITQYTYFQQVGGIQCSVPPVEITYGLERIATFIQNVETHFDINWNGRTDERKLTYGDVLKRFEREFSCYNFDVASVDILLAHFNDYEKECNKLLAHNLVMPAYEQCVKANHCFNLLDARGVISVTERAGYIARVRALAKACCSAWLKSLQEEGADHE